MLFNKYVIKLLRAFTHLTNYMGFVVKRKNTIDAVLAQHSNALNELISSYQAINRQPGINGIIFSKDRPLQLYGLIQSYYQNVTNPPHLHVLYSASEREYEHAYQELIDLCDDYDIDFHLEHDFKKDPIQN